MDYIKLFSVWITFDWEKYYFTLFVGVIKHLIYYWTQLGSVVLCKGGNNPHDVNQK